jgi:hypothetical protein
MQFRLSPSPNISARSFGDEIVAANFVTGIYYSLLGSAAQIWEGLIAGVPLDRIVAEVSVLSDVDSADFARAADALVEAMLTEKLIVPAENFVQSNWKPLPASEGRYGLPVLERFTDMQDLLLLDPVHEVEEMGWPHTNPVQSG